MNAFTNFRSDETAQCIHRMEAVGNHWHPELLRPVQEGRMSAAFFMPGHRVPLAILDPARLRQPLAIVLGDDAGASAGPDAFPSVRRLFRWASWIMLHGAGAEPWHYRMAAEATLLMRRCLIVETTSAGLPAWMALRLDLAPSTPGPCFRIPDGGPRHPLVTDAECGH